MIVNLWRYRAYIVKNALSDVRYRYAGSAMGIAWNVITPLAQIVIYSFVFSQIMVTRLTGLGSQASFTLYLCAGLLPWAAFTDCVLRGANAFIENAHYLKKLPIPEQVFVAKNAMAATLFLGISMTALGLVTILVGSPLSLAWLGVPDAHRARGSLEVVQRGGGPRRDPAALGIAETWMLENRPENAIRILSRLVARRSGEVTPAALGRLAAVAQRLRAPEVARIANERLRRDYPRSFEARGIGPDPVAPGPHP